jgi:hypothetical protein
MAISASRHPIGPVDERQCRLESVSKELFSGTIVLVTGGGLISLCLYGGGVISQRYQAIADTTADLLKLNI